jgi:hypothetical protein
MTTFSAGVYQNEYLPEGGTEVNAIVTVTATTDTGQASSAPAAAGARGTTEATEIIVIDTSGSMNYPPAKLRAAKHATAAAIDCIRDGVWFGIIAGTHLAHYIYPGTSGLVQATDEHRAEAKAAVGQLGAQGGTAIGTWLSLANELFATRPDGIHHAILLTDGKDESESPEEFSSRLAACVGQFQCDCRGIGTDWVVSELRKISSALLGTVDIIAKPEDMTADFEAMIEHAMGKATADVRLRLWAPQGAQVEFVKQVAPTVEDLTEKRAAGANPLTGDYPTGAWGDESRDYHVCIKVRPGQVGDEMLAGRVSLVVDDQPVSQALVKAIWTDDTQLSTRINREVAHYTGQAELAGVIQEGLEARKAGDDATATMKLGRAVQLAAESGNDDTAKLLSKVVDVEDAATGTVRLKKKVEDVDEMALDTRSTKTVRVAKPESP